VANGVPEIPEGVIKQGYLFKKTTKAGKLWKCGWFALDVEGVLHYWKNQKVSKTRPRKAKVKRKKEKRKGKGKKGSKGKGKGKEKKKERKRQGIEKE